jgi:hypothetical protein
MVTDSWDRFKAAVVSLWERAQPGRADNVADDLGKARVELLAAREAGGERTREAEQDLVGEWRSRLRRLLADCPEAAVELSRLVAEYGEREQPTPGTVNMHASTGAGGRVYQAGHDLTITER